MRTWTYEAASLDEGKTLEQILRAAGFSRKEISRLKFLPMGITVDGKKSRVNKKISAGEVICLQLGKNQAAETVSQQDIVTPDIKEYIRDFPEICWEDEDILILNKPSGLSCHPGRGHYLDNLGSQAAAYCREKGEDPTIRIVGRLDKDTSGLVVLAKNQTAAARLWKQKEKQIFQKTYFAAVHGVPEKENGRIRLAMGSVPGEKNRMEIREDGKEAATDYQVADTIKWKGKDVSVVKCWILTGRTHQIRVHMAALGHPIVGDLLYGKPDESARLCLHAGEIKLYQPFTGEKIQICVLPDYPETFPGYEEIMKYSGRKGEEL